MEEASAKQTALEWIHKAEQSLQAQQFAQALAYYQKAQQAGVDPSLILKGLSFAQYHLADGENALANLQRYLQLCASDAEGWHNLAILALQKKDWPLAESALDQTLKLGRHSAFAWGSLLEVKQQLQKPLDGLLALQQGLSRFPQDAKLQHWDRLCTDWIEGLTVLTISNQAAIVTLIQLAERWLSVYPTSACLFAFKLIQVSHAKPEVSSLLLACFERQLRQFPDVFLNLYGYGLLLHLTEREAQSIPYYLRALQQEPNHVDLLVNLGLAQRKLNHSARSIVSLERARALGRDDAKVNENLAMSYAGVGRLEDALNAYAKAIQQMPSESKMHFSYGILLLLAGRFKQGWSEYAQRIQTLRLTHKPERAHRWMGQALGHKHLAVIHEQGLGDSIQCLRYIPALGPLASKITVKVQPPLLQQAHRLRDKPAHVQIVATDTPIPDADYFCTLMDLPGLFNTDLNSIPYAEGYLQADPQKCAQWQARLAGMSGKKIGLVWAGNPKHARDQERSLTLAQFKPLLMQQGLNVISLQMGPPLAQIQTLNEGRIQDFSAQIQDFSDTAALIAQLDLVIAVDTSVAHMAAALGVPTWILINYMPDWRWLMTRRDSPWYQSVRLFRQAKLDDWQEVLTQLFSEVALWQQQQTWVENAQLFADIQKAKLNEAKEGASVRLKADGGDVEALRALAIVSEKQGDIAVSCDYLQRILQARGFDLDASLRLGQHYLQQEQFAPALAHLLPTLPLQMHNANLWVLTGQALHRLNQQRMALALYQRVLAKQPEHKEALSESGSSLKQLGYHQQALAYWQKVYQLDPDMLQNTVRLGMLELLMGDLKSGWEHYDKRWLTDKYLTYRPNIQRPLWHGQAVPEGVVLIYDEQGLGDSIQFLRYLPWVAARVKSVRLMLKTALHCLAPNLPTNVQLLSSNVVASDFDYHASLMSLPLILDKTTDCLGEAVPYLRAPAERIEHWATLFQQARGLRVGLVWAGNPEHLKDQSRSIALRVLAPWFQLDGIEWFALQMGAGVSQLVDCDFPLTPLHPHIHDFNDTAAMMAHLDLVISVDTSVAHLAGALGVPCWILLACDPDWRWRLEGEHSDWYPSVRLFRQSEIYQWDNVIQSVQNALIIQAANMPQGCNG